jgi:Tfp pilus assembly protein PilO
MRSVREARRLLLIIAIVVLVVAAAATAWLVSPAGRSREALNREYNDLRAQYQVQIREIGPARDIEKGLAQAREQQAAFFAQRIPTHYSTISETLGELASKNQVLVSAVKYDAKDTEVPGLQRLTIAAQITGDYGNEMKFINAMERSKLFFVINSVNLGGAEGGKVRLGLNFETYLRSAS